MGYLEYRGDDCLYLGFISPLNYRNYQQWFQLLELYWILTFKPFHVHWLTWDGPTPTICTHTSFNVRTTGRVGSPINLPNENQGCENPDFFSWHFLFWRIACLRRCKFHLFYPFTGDTNVFILFHKWGLSKLFANVLAVLNCFPCLYNDWVNIAVKSIWTIYFLN